MYQSTQLQLPSYNYSWNYPVFVVLLCTQVQSSVTLYSSTQVQLPCYVYNYSCSVLYFILYYFVVKYRVKLTCTQVQLASWDFRCKYRVQLHSTWGLKYSYLVTVRIIVTLYFTVLLCTLVIITPLYLQLKLPCTNVFKYSSIVAVYFTVHCTASYSSTE